jgi:hypothetical protein
MNQMALHRVFLCLFVFFVANVFVSLIALSTLRLCPSTVLRAGGFAVNHP